MSPTTARRRHSTTAPTAVGPLTLVAEGDHLIGIYLSEHRHALDRSAFGEAADGDSLLDAAAGQLAEYFAGTRREFDLPLRPAGTEFQLRVWDALRQIPFGSTESYGSLAARIGRPGASRAVGLANGRNPLSVVVPCHRVVGADGSLTGYGGGVENKRILLELEAGRAPARLPGLGG